MRAGIGSLCKGPLRYTTIYMSNEDRRNKALASESPIIWSKC